MRVTSRDGRKKLRIAASSYCVRVCAIGCSRQLVLVDTYEPVTEAQIKRQSEQA